MGKIIASWRDALGTEATEKKRFTVYSAAKSFFS
jgi:hypothetical protein